MVLTPTIPEDRPTGVDIALTSPGTVMIKQSRWSVTGPFVTWRGGTADLRQQLL